MTVPASPDGFGALGAAGPELQAVSTATAAAALVSRRTLC
jgi:hypothetical protein